MLVYFISEWQATRQILPTVICGTQQWLAQHSTARSGAVARNTHIGNMSTIASQQHFIILPLDVSYVSALARVCEHWRVEKDVLPSDNNDKHIHVSVCVLSVECWRIK